MELERLKGLKNVVEVAVSELDLGEIKIGDFVCVITNNGTYWVAILAMTGFHGQAQGATRIAVWGADLTPEGPSNRSCTRLLIVGQDFEVSTGSLLGSRGAIEKIVLPVNS